MSVREHDGDPGTTDGTPEPPPAVPTADDANRARPLPARTAFAPKAAAPAPKAAAPAPKAAAPGPPAAIPGLTAAPGHTAAPAPRAATSSSTTSSAGSRIRGSGAAAAQLRATSPQSSSVPRASGTRPETRGAAAGAEHPSATAQTPAAGAATPAAHTSDSPETPAPAAPAGALVEHAPASAQTPTSTRTDSAAEDVPSTGQRSAPAAGAERDAHASPTPQTPTPDADAARAEHLSAMSQPAAHTEDTAAPRPLSGDAVATRSRRQQRENARRPSFLVEERREEPAREGVRGALNRFGLRLAPDVDEQSARDDEIAVSQHWPGPRTIAVVNGKGGAGKTPTTILLAAVFARFGGAGVLAWDNNQTRGTLGWRTQSGVHDRTLLEMLPATGHLLGPQAQSADLANFVHHQPREKYDVLRSKPIRLAHENRLHPQDVDAIHAVAAKFYRLIVIDSGNDESDPMWLRMIDHADQLVVATTTRADHAEAGALLLEALEDRDERSARLAAQSVVVVSQADPKATPTEVETVVEGYRALAREVIAIPFDHEMVDGHLEYGALARRTQRAWLSAAAAVARGL